MRVFILAHYSRRGACSRYRFYQYMPELERRGHVFAVDCLYQDFMLSLKGMKLGFLNLPFLLFFYMRRAFLLPWISGYDCVIVEKELFPAFPAFFDLAFMKALRGRVVLDYDDAVFHKYDDSPSALVRGLCSGKISRLMSAADLVVAGNEYLREYALRAGSRSVELIPTVVDETRYQARKAESAGEGIAIGWIGTGPNARHLKLIEPALLALGARFGLELRIIGGDRIDLDPAIAVIYLPWSEATEASLLEGLDIGVMPLVDGPWERGKCGLKLVQYMAAGLPVLASAVGANRDIVRHGVDGYLVHKSEEWTTYLEALCSSAGERGRMGSAGRRRFEECYSLGSRMDQFEATLAAAAMIWYQYYFIAILFLLALCLFTGSDRAGGLKYGLQNKLYLPLIFILTWLFAGLRAGTIDRDYSNYYIFYRSFSGESSNLLTLDRDPGFGLLYLFFSKLGLSFEMVVFITTAMALAAMYYFSIVATPKRAYLPILIYLILCKSFALHLMTQDRVGIAIPLMSLGIFYLCEKKYLYGLALYGAAAVFHVSILMSLPVVVLLLFNKEFNSRLWVLSLIPVGVLFFSNQTLQAMVRLSLTNMSRTSSYLETSDNVSFASGYTVTQMVILAYILTLWKKIPYFGRAAVYASGLGLLYKFIFGSSPTIAYRSSELFCLIDMYVFVLPLSHLKPLARLYYTIFLVAILGYIFFYSLDILEPYRTIFS